MAISGRLRSGSISDVKTNKETTHLYSQLRKYLSPTDQRCSFYQCTTFTVFTITKITKIVRNANSAVPGVPSGELTFCYGKSPFLMGKSTMSMAIFNCYVSSPEGKRIYNHSLFNGETNHQLQQKVIQSSQSSISGYHRSISTLPPGCHFNFGLWFWSYL